MRTHDIRTEEHALSAGGLRLAATTVLAAANRPPSILTLHGLGVTATRGRIRYLLDYLAGHGLSSVCFDFSGNGESDGKLDESCLSRRRQEVLAAATLLGDGEPPTLIGTSMGAHLAAWVTPLLRPRNLVLFCPAAYPAEAAERTFGADYPRPGAYADSPAFAGLREFGGNLLVVAAQRDAVVSLDVVERYLESAPRAATKRIIWLAECDHFVHAWLERNDKERGAIERAVLETLAGAAQHDGERG